MRALYGYCVELFCPYEVWITGPSTKRIKISVADCLHWLYNNGPVDNSGQRGVALGVSSSANKSLISWTPISPRIAMARFRSQPLHVTVIAVYASTLSTKASIKDKFYEQLQKAIDQVPARDILIIAGD